VREVPPDARLLTLRYLDEKKDDEFRWFASLHQQLTANQPVDKPKDMPNLAPALGFAFWYLGLAVRENKLSVLGFRTFVLDVIAMLEGKSENERLRRSPSRGDSAMSDPYDLGQRVAKEVIAVIDHFVATRLVPVTQEFGAVIRREWKRAPQSTEAEVTASWSIIMGTVEEFARRTLRELYDRLGESNYTLLLIEPKDERSLSLVETYIHTVFEQVTSEMTMDLKREVDRARQAIHGR
jgi:hypothetical protein